MIEKSNLGIISVEENADYQFIPAIRAIECSRDLLSLYFDNQKVAAIVSVVEKNSHPDPKKINKFGIVDLEYLQEFLLTEYDNYNKKVLEELKLILSPFWVEDKEKLLMKSDAIMLIRSICPDKFNLIVNNKQPLEAFDSIWGSEKFEVYIPESKVIDLCFEYRVLLPNDMQNYLKGEYNQNQLKAILVEGLATHHIAFRKLVENKEKYGLDDSFISVWQNRIKNILEHIDLPSKSITIFWKILCQEVNRLLKQF